MEKLQQTKSYGQFVFSKENRKVEMHALSADHKRLLEDMKRNGFRPSCPLMVRHDGNGSFVIMDGQHRYTFAKHLGLPIYFVVDHTPIDIAEFQRTQSAWTNADHAHRWASLGNAEYDEGLRFSETFGIPLPTAFSMLAGSMTFGNVRDDFHAGKFKAKEREFAYAVARVYADLCKESSKLKKNSVLNALYKCMRIEGFESVRLVKGAQRKGNAISRPSTENDALTLMEDLYNFGRANRVPLAHIATENSKLRKETFGRSGNLAVTHALI